MLSVVGEVPDGAPRTVAGLDELLLEAKLSVPGPRPGLVSRSGLVESVRERVPGGGWDGAGRLREVDPAGAVGTRRGPATSSPRRAVQRPYSPSSATHPVGARTGTGASRRSCEPGHRPAAAGELHPLHMTTEAGPRGTVTDGDPGATPAHRSDLGADPAGPITEETRHVRLATRTEC